MEQLNVRNKERNQGLTLVFHFWLIKKVNVAITKVGKTGEAQVFVEKELKFCFGHVQIWNAMRHPVSQVGDLAGP